MAWVKPGPFPPPAVVFWAQTGSPLKKKKSYPSKMLGVGSLATQAQLFKNLHI